MNNKFDSYIMVVILISLMSVYDDGDVSPTGVNAKGILFVLTILIIVKLIIAHTSEK